jgi:hypothetical protein
MNTTIARLTTELASWKADLANRKQYVSTHTYSTKKEYRYALICIADFEKVVEGKSRQLNEIISSSK